MLGCAFSTKRIAQLSHKIIKEDTALRYKVDGGIIMMGFTINYFGRFGLKSSGP